MTSAVLDTNVLVSGFIGEDKPASTPIPRRWVQVMNKIPSDPWGSEYGYRFPGKKRAGEFEMYSKGPDLVENTPDDLSSQDD